MEAEQVPGYRTLKKLADGAVAEVFLAEPETGGDRVVLKVMRAELNADPHVVGRFLDEAKVCEGLSHPNILRHRSSGQLADGRVFLVTEYLEGVDLATQLKLHGPLTPEQLVRLVVPLCGALDHVHARGVVHRDIKPENVFLAGGLEQYAPKLLDFGLAHFRGNKSARTADGVILATPEYTPPECVQGAKADARSDLYALGVLLHECLTGAPPFTSINYAELLLMHLHDPPPPVQGPGAVLAPVIQRCLSKAPADRYASAGEVARALEECLSGEALPGTLVRSSGPRPQGTEPASAPPVAPVGERLGSFELVKVLGEGAMGTVYLARHLRLGRQVALKVLKPEHSQNREFVQRFFQEARTVNEINHEHIVEVHDFVEDDASGRFFCVMELLIGQSLGQQLSRGVMPLQRTVHIARQVGDALAAAHRVGVIHRDVKPDNVFLAERSGVSDYVKVLDFGVAKLVTPLGEQRPGATLAGTIIGTPAYMAPEQASGAATDARADIYAFGTVLYEMLTGRTPFDGQSFGQLVVQINTLPPPPLPARNSLGEPIPGALSVLVLRCLEKDPARRPQTMEEVVQTLRSLERTRAPVDSGDELSLSVVRKSKAPFIALGVAGVLLVGVVALVLAQGGEGEPAPLPTTTVTPVPPPPEPLPALIPKEEAKVELSLGSEPAGATVVRLDSGQTLGVTPLSVTLPRGEQALKLRFSLAGHRAGEETVKLSGDTKLAVRLLPLKSTKRSTKRSTKKRGESRDSVIDPFRN